MNKVILLAVLLYFPLAFSQSKEDKKRDAEIKALLYDAQKAIENNDLSSAEAKYRKAIALDEKNTVAQYNLGTAYYNKGKNKEAGKQFVKAAENAKTKEEKHKIYHNLGNVLMNEKSYKGAVEAYKNALRNNPKEYETRYNLALAKLMQEEHGNSGGEDENQEENQEQQDNQDQQDQGENQEEQNKGDEGEDNQDKGDEGENQEEQNEEGNPQEQDSPEDGEARPQPVQGKLSQEQIQSLLEAMNNEEKKAQDKINAERQKGTPVKPDKD